MDRINRFLAARPAKHRKVLKYHDKAYEITKEDIKLVRAYRSRRCLDPAFKPDRPPDLRFSSEPMEPAEPSRVSRPDNSGVFIRKLRERHERNPVRARKTVSRNEMADVWADDDVDALRAYKQEWAYTIKDSYDRPLESCRFTREHLEDELRKVYLSHFRPRELKTKSLEELLPKLPDPQSLRPYPEAVAREWRLRGHKCIRGGIAYAADENTIEAVDLRFDKRIGRVAVAEKINHVRVNQSGETLFSTDRRLYRLGRFSGEEEPALLHESRTLIKDIFLSNDQTAVLTGKTVNLYANGAAEFVPAKTFIAKHENPNRVKIFGGAAYVSTANGLLIEAAEKGDIKTLNYVVDFTHSRELTYVINNMNRLIVIDKNYGIRKNIVQHEMGREIKVHRTLNLIAILFSDEIGLYKRAGDEYVPVNTLAGRYRTIEWDDCLPWLYACRKGSVVLFT